MPIVKKGRRRHHYRPQCAERKWQNRRKQTPLQIITNILENKDLITLPCSSVNDKETTATSGLSVQVEQDQHPAITEIQGATQTTAETSNSQENITSNKRDHPRSQFDCVKAELSQSLSGWHLYTDSDTIQLSLISNAPPEPSVVRMTLTIHKTLQWDVCVHGKLLSPSHAIICKHPNLIQSEQDVQSICIDLQEAVPCEGNSDKEFVDLLVNR